jgi:regulator of sigma D
VLSGHYEHFDKQLHKLEAIKAKNLHPVAQLDERVELVEERMHDAQDIF